MEYISQEELSNFHSQLGEIIKELDAENPFEVVGFANSLIGMGNHLLTQSNSKLILQAYSTEELMEFREKIQENKEELNESD